MKLKQILSKKTIEMLTEDDKKVAEIINKDFKDLLVKDEKGNYQVQPSNLYYFLEKPLKKVKPHIELFVVAGVFEYLRKHDKRYYNQLWQNIRKNKSNAEIDVKQIEEKVPLLKPFNEMLGLYKIK